MEGVNFDHRPVEKGSILTVCEHGKQVGGGAQSDFQHEQGCGVRVIGWEPESREVIIAVCQSEVAGGELEGHMHRKQSSID